jgi:hypothetical protein
VTEAEKERLAMLAEEAGEIVQIIGKILRHGYDSHHPDDPERITNKEHLVRELRDLDGVVYGMCLKDDLKVENFSMAHSIAAWNRKLKWSHHQGDKE